MTSSPTDALHWRQADADVHVATLDGEYAGFIDVSAGGVRAHSALGDDLGLHHSTPAARAAVVASVLSTSPRGLDTHRPRRKSRRGTSVAPAARRKGKTRWPLAP